MARLTHQTLFHNSYGSNGTAMPSNWFAASTGDGGVVWSPAASGGTTHTILSGTHTDTTAAAVVRGDMVAATSNAAWKRQPTPAADASTSDRFLGTVNGDPHWRPRFYGVDDLTSSTSNAFTGQVDLRAGAGIAIAVTSNTATISALTAQTNPYGPATHNLLSSTHPDTTPAAVTRGDMIAATSNASWKRMGTPAADAFTSDRHLGLVNLDPTWTTRFYGVDSLSSSGSNSMTGQVNFRTDSTIGISLSSNTATLGLNMPVAFSAGLAMTSNTRADPNPGRFRLPATSVGPSTAAEGDIWYDPYYDVVVSHDGNRALHSSAMGLVPFVYGAQLASTAALTASTLNLAASGGSVAIPIFLVGPMLLQSISVWNTDTTLTRIWEVALYFEQFDTTNVLTRIGGTYGRETFIAAAGSTRTITVDNPGMTLPPGIVWAVIRNLHTVNTFGLGEGSSNTMSAANHTRTKTVAGSQLAALTLDFVAGWVGRVNPTGVRLNGRIFGTTGIL